jgi:hypothetical protein
VTYNVVCKLVPFRELFVELPLFLVVIYEMVDSIFFPDTTVIAEVVGVGWKLHEVVESVLVDFAIEPDTEIARNSH